MTAAVSGDTTERAEDAEPFLGDIHVGPAAHREPFSLCGLGGLCGESLAIRTVTYGD